MRPLHVALLGPIAAVDVASLVACDATALPAGLQGAPMMATLLGELLARGHRVTAATLSSDRAPHEGNAVVEHGSLRLVFAPLRPHAWRWNGRHPGRCLDGWRVERAALVHALREAAPDVVHAHWTYEYAAAALDSALPHVVTCHDAPDVIARLQTRATSRLYRRVQARLAHRVLAAARVVSAVSPYLAQQIQPLTPAPVALVPNALAQALPAREAEAGRARLLVAANGFDARKNSAAALRAAALAGRRLADVELVMLGAGHEPDGAAQAWWRRNAPPGAAPRVRFMGACSHAEVLAWMARSDVLVHAAVEESFGLVVAEAMAIGLPVVAGADSGAVPWVTGGHARLVDVRDAEVIAQAVAALLDDPHGAAAMAQRAREEAQRRFAPGAVVDAYETLYARAVGDAVQAPGGTRLAAGDAARC